MYHRVNAIESKHTGINFYDAINRKNKQRNEEASQVADFILLFKRIFLVLVKVNLQYLCHGQVSLDYGLQQQNSHIWFTLQCKFLTRLFPNHKEDCGWISMKTWKLRWLVHGCGVVFPAEFSCENWLLINSINYWDFMRVVNLKFITQGIPWGIHLKDWPKEQTIRNASKWTRISE